MEEPRALEAPRALESDEKENFLAPNGVFEIGISPEPIGIFRRGKRQRVAYVRDFSAAKLQLSDSCENIAGDWQNLALIRFSAVM